MPLHPDLAAKLHLMHNIDFHALDEDALARMAEFYTDAQSWTIPEGVTVESAQAVGPHGPIPVRIYRPTSSAPLAGLVWAHGGGFASGDLDMGEAHVVSAELALRSGAIVVSVGYRLAGGETRYPVPIDDVHAAYRWAVAGGVSNVVERWSLGGASAGAALALSAALRIRDTDDVAIAGILLAYPFAHFPNPAVDPDVAEMLAGLPPALRFGSANVEWMVRNYVGRISGLPADALPGGAKLAGLPPVRVIVSEYDDLRSSGELLARQLEEAGVDVSLTLAVGMPHGHLNRVPTFPEVDRSLDYFAEFLRRR